VQWNVRAAVPADMEPVTGGPYRWVRHPNYVAVAVEFAALPVFGGGYAEALALSAANAAILRWRIRAEERLLDAIPAYRRAFAGVPRFVPLRRSPLFGHGERLPHPTVRDTRTRVLAAEGLVSKLRVEPDRLNLRVQLDGLRSALGSDLLESTNELSSDAAPSS